MTAIAGDNRAQLQHTMQTQRENGNHVLHPGASGLGTSYWELLRLPTGTGRQRVTTATTNHY